MPRHEMSVISLAAVAPACSSGAYLGHNEKASIVFSARQQPFQSFALIFLLTNLQHFSPTTSQLLAFPPRFWLLVFIDAYLRTQPRIDTTTRLKQR